MASIDQRPFARKFILVSRRVILSFFLLQTCIVIGFWTLSHGLIYQHGLSDDARASALEHNGLVECVVFVLTAAVECCLLMILYKRMRPWIR